VEVAKRRGGIVGRGLAQSVLVVVDAGVGGIDEAEGFDTTSACG